MSTYTSTFRPAPVRKFAAAAVILTLTFPPAFAFADPNTAADTYREASEAYQRGNFKEAATLLEKAYQEDQNLIYKYNQILAHQGSKNYTEGLRVLDQHREAMLADGRFDDIDDIRAQLEASHAEQIKREEQKNAAANPPANYENEKDNTITPPPAPDQSTSSPNYLAWSLVGVGGAALVSSALFGSYIFISDEIDRLDQYQKLGSDDNAFRTVYGDDSKKLSVSDKEAQDFHQLMAYTMLGTGVVLVGTGLALWYFNIPGTDANTSASAQSNAEQPLKVRFSPYFSTESAGASMHLKF